MKHIGIVKPETLVTILNVLGMPVILIYALSMFVYPWVAVGWDWHQVQNVWDRWQGLNVGMLAFASSLTAFSISRYNAEKQREREFRASKAFLPDALSELSSYLASSATVFKAGWEAARGEEVQVTAPNPPPGYRDVFRECIRYAEPEVGDFLARMLVRLQVHSARLEAYIEQQGDDTWVSPDKHNLISYLYRLGELQAMVNKLFPYARSMASFDSGPLDWEDFRNAYGNLDLWPEEYYIDDQMNLEAFTKRVLERADPLDTQQGQAADARNSRG
uniref:hypothetical protein n=1 Tax=Halomonas sp. TaxID=1486246 RepID=UPI00260CD271|nr:hypothetical protein [Halomonas sp.]